eukprot:7054685-Lingulodinium_polyedra.AAC.1
MKRTSPLAARSLELASSSCAAWCQLTTALRTRIAVPTAARPLEFSENANRMAPWSVSCDVRSLRLGSDGRQQ